MKEFLSILFVLLLISCKQGNKETILIKGTFKEEKLDSLTRINNPEIENLLKLEENFFCGEGYRFENMEMLTKKDFDVTFSVIEKMLYANQYKEPTYKVFKEKILTCFGIDIDNYSEDMIIIYRNDNFEEPSEIQDPYFEMRGDHCVYDFCLSNLFISKKKKIITLMLPLRDIYDNRNQSIMPHKEIIALNRYLFNDDKEQMNYLANEKHFMYHLWSFFRFESTIEEANKNSIEFFYTDYPEDQEYKIGEKFFSKNKKGKLFIESRMLNTIVKLFEEKKHFKYIYPLKTYASYLINDKYKRQFTRNEKNKIIAYLANTYDPLFKQYYDGEEEYDETTILYDYKAHIGEKEWEKVKEEYKKNNYYNLPYLLPMIENADEYGTFLNNYKDYIKGEAE